MRLIDASLLAILSCVISSPVLAQSTDAASERARLGEERIRIEAERREQAARDQQQVVAVENSQNVSPGEQPASVAASGSGPEATTAEPNDASRGPVEVLPAEPASTTNTVSTESAYQAAGPEPETSPSGDVGSTDISRALDQLRELGELKDAGYLTDEEFDRIKQRILDTQF